MSVTTSQVLQQSMSDVKLMEDEKRKDRGGIVRTVGGVSVPERHKSWLQRKERVLQKKEWQQERM